MATKAKKRSTLPRRYYVYELIDPFGGEVFYVGKGKGRRMYQHETDAKGMRSGNKDKHERIASIHRLGGKVEYNVVKDDLDERSAYRLERATIRKHGIHNLTNAVRGQNDPNFKVKLKAQDLLARLRPPQYWRRPNPDLSLSPHQIYWMIRMLCWELAKDGTAPMNDAVVANRRWRERAQQFA